MCHQNVSKVGHQGVIVRIQEKNGSQEEKEEAHDQKAVHLLVKAEVQDEVGDHVGDDDIRGTVTARVATAVVVTVLSGEGRE